MKGVIAVLVVVALAVAGRFIYLSQSSSSEENTQVPVITVMEILHATDLQAGIKRAVSENDNQAIDDWLDKARNVGEQAALSKSDMAYLSSGQAREYVIFNAKRALFNEKFETRYLNLRGIDDLKQAYPEAKDLFPRAETLLQKRNDIIERIAQTLAGGDVPDEEHIREAQAMWKARYREQQQPALSPAADAG
ncbi:hypothetical protein [Alteromonas antoniana]|uniref:hypothetical protein n=1 Tax=Alteromonas antoniana TaxID=2803813 RepID=UPI001C440711|nr:hypothetical protein [Alteromonas antoniana]